MENASKALLMAGGVLLGILIIALMFTLFINSKEVTNRYENNKRELSVQQFNTNFIKYINKNLTIYEAVTIKNFAIENGVRVDVKGKEELSIKGNNFNYKMTILDYDEDGYINKIYLEKKIN